ncbi:hypothetical protein H1C71_014542 [Ictidomys tridecemlineatus]|nr:hypothetical protein H1C71_014542 [Ictidomys tridecemlineatus]
MSREGPDGRQLQTTNTHVKKLSCWQWGRLRTLMKKKNLHVIRFVPLITQTPVGIILLVMDNQFDWIKTCLRLKASRYLNEGDSRNDWHVDQQTLADTHPKCRQQSPIGWRLGWNKIWKNKEAAADASLILLGRVLDYCCDGLRTLYACPFTLPKQTLPCDSPGSFQASGPKLELQIIFPSCSGASSFLN